MGRISEFWKLHNFEMGKARDFKFGVPIDLGMPQLMDDKIPAKWGHGSLGPKF